MDDSGHFYKPLQVQLLELYLAFLSSLCMLPCMRKAAFPDTPDTSSMPLSTWTACHADGTTWAARVEIL